MKRFLILLLILGIIGGLYGFYLFYKKPLDTREQKVEFEVTSDALVKEFAADEAVATKKYVDKIIVVSGKVSEVNVNSATIFLESSDPMSAVTCSFYIDESPQLKGAKVGQDVKVKGKCTGKLSDVILNNCSLYSIN